MSKTILSIEDLKVHYPIKKGVLQRVVNHVRAVDGISLSLQKGHTLALVGESGCGKTTAGKAICGLVEATGGKIDFQGTNLLMLSEKQFLPRRRNIQMIFQDPAGSLNPRMLVKDIVAEGLLALGITKDKAEVATRVTHMLELCGLGTDALYRYPHEFSGGQRQRICIARALVVEPELVICDEPTSALDVSVQASVLNLLKELQQKLGLTYLFITHDLSVVEYLSDRVAVMYLGQIVEEALTEELFSGPKHPYTEALLRSAPGLQSEPGELIQLQGDVPSPINPPPHCRFYSRCDKHFDRCKAEAPELKALGSAADAQVRCLLYEAL